MFLDVNKAFVGLDCMGTVDLAAELAGYRDALRVRFVNMFPQHSRRVEHLVTLRTWNRFFSVLVSPMHQERDIRAALLATMRTDHFTFAVLRVLVRPHSLGAVTGVATQVTDLLYGLFLVVFALPLHVLLVISGRGVPSEHLGAFVTSFCAVVYYQDVVLDVCAS